MSRIASRFHSLFAFAKHSTGCSARLIIALALFGASISDTAQAKERAADATESAYGWSLPVLRVIESATGFVQQVNQTLVLANENVKQNQRVEDQEKTVPVAEPSALPLCEPGVIVVDWGDILYSYRDHDGHCVPAEVPKGLPANYLAPHPKYGALIDFLDEYDSFGTRVTSRTYANGHVIIETPRIQPYAEKVTNRSRSSVPPPPNRS